MIIKSGVYIIQSKTESEKFYVGSTIDLNQRKYRHYYTLKRNKHDNSNLQEHYNKYGKEDLFFIIIERCEKEKLIEREQFYLDQWTPYFNITAYADSTRGVIPSDDVRLKMSKSRKDKFFGEKNSFFGKRHSEESLKMMSKSKDSIKKPILQFDLQGNFIKEWESMNEVQKTLGYKYNNIREVALGKYGYRTAYGFIWKFKNNTDLYDNNCNIKRYYKDIGIIQFDLNGNFVKEYLRVIDIERENNYKSSNIIRVLKGRREQAYGFKWKYKNIA